MARLPRRVTDDTVRILAEYAGLALPEDRVPLLREQIQNVLEYTRSWADDLDLLDVRPAHLYRIPWEVPDPLAGPQG